MLLVSTARLIINLLKLPLLPLWWLFRLAARPKGGWLLVRLRPRLTELERPRPFFLRFLPNLARMLPTPVQTLRRLAEHAAADHRIEGVVLEIPPLQAGWATCAGVREVVGKLRAAGTHVVAYLPQGGGNREMYIASSAERVLIGPQATLMALGLSLESRYLKSALDKLGVSVQAIARGEFKTAAENVTRESMSEPQRQQLQALLDTLDRELVSAMASLPGMDEARVRSLFEAGLVRGQDAVTAGFAADVCYEDELPLKLSGGDEPARLVRAPRYLAFKEAKFFRRLTPKPYVAVIDVHGPIVSQARGRNSADPERLASALRAARSDRLALGVVLHVNSPGGSALASDLIHREVVRLREKKPVVACFGDVAASGGYYVAAGTDAIVAEPVTITGSIGVVMARVVARDLLDRVGVRTEVLKSAPHADIFSPARELTEEEKGILDREADGFYRAFVSIVAEGRKRPFEEVEPLARGRVWSGADAAAQGLVDRLGGLDAAVEEVRSRLKVPEAARRRIEPRRVRPRRMEPPTPEPPPATASSALEVMAPDLAPEVLELLALLRTGERALYWAPAPRA